MLKAEDKDESKDKILASRPTCPLGLNITVFSNESFRPMHMCISLIIRNVSGLIILNLIDSLTFSCQFWLLSIFCVSCYGPERITYFEF